VPQKKRMPEETVAKLWHVDLLLPQSRIVAEATGERFRLCLILPVPVP